MATRYSQIITEEDTASDFESDFLPQQILKSFNVGIDVVTSIAFGTLEEECNNFEGYTRYEEYTSGSVYPTNVPYPTPTPIRGPTYRADIAFTSLINSSHLKICDIENGEILPIWTRFKNLFNDIVCKENILHAVFRNKGCILLAKVVKDKANVASIRQQNIIDIELLSTGICCLRDDALAVCLTDDYTYTLTATSRRLVRIFNKKNDPVGYITVKNYVMRKEVEFDGDEKLFTYPKRIAQSNTGDLWVVNRFNDRSGNVIVTDIDGKLKFRYTRNLNNSSFDPRDVARNINESMIIADFRNHLVHLVKDDGTFLQYIMTSDNGLSFPSAVAIDTYDRAWIGCDFGKMHIVRFNKPLP